MQSQVVEGMVPEWLGPQLVQTQIPGYTRGWIREVE
jgi:hypothetical protein